MIYSSKPGRNPNPLISIPKTIKRPPLSSKPSSLNFSFIHSFQHHRHHHHNPKALSAQNTTNESIKPKTQILKPVILAPNQIPLENNKTGSRNGIKRRFSQVGSQQMLVLCGFGYWVQGFRCFPWLALNYHMAHTLKLHPSTLQFVQHSANLPMVAKPLYGVLSDVFYIGGAHRIPYICIGVLLQVLSWGPLALIQVAGDTLPTLMACVLLSNLGASITEVAKDALIAEFSQKHKVSGLQSYAFMALAAGGILGNLFGGFFLLKIQPKTMFLLFSLLLTFQLATSFRIREDSLGLSMPSDQSLVRKSVSENLSKQFSNLIMAINEEGISRPLTWLIASITAVPILSGTIFCYQTQSLNLDPSIIGFSKVIGQLMLLPAAVLYDRYWKRISLRKLIGTVQIVYAASLLLDLVLVKQINLKLGIPNETCVLCLSGLAETIAQFKLLPFMVLFANLCPPGCEGSLTSFLASTLCLSSIVGGFLGVGLASLIGVSSGDYSSLPVGFLVQSLAALVPLIWISCIPISQAIVEKERKKGRSKRSRKSRRVGRVAFDCVYAYRPQRESEGEK